MNARRSSVRAFTLIELTVSLVAGLVVAMAVAMLSHEATATFNEEVRLSASEATLRAASDRLRADLQRASYMSTPNIQMDPNIATTFGQVGNVPTGSLTSLQTLQGVRLYAGSPTQNTANGLTQDSVAVNNVTPSSIDLTGNFSGTDQFEVQSVATVGNCCKITLVASSPATFRMLNANDAGVPDPNADAEMQAIFAPAPTGAGTFTSRQFYVRFVDLPTNHAQYLRTCNPSGTQVAGMPEPVGTVIQPYVLTTACPLTGSATKMTATNGNIAGLATVNPVQTVRWEIVGPTPGTNPTAVPQQDKNALDNQAMEAGVDPLKYDLVRSLVNTADGTTIPETTEVIAEYAVDMEFAFSVETGDTTGANPAIVSYDFGSSSNQLVADIKVANPVHGPNTPDPQRIRSVRFLLSTRAAIADRTASLPVQTAGDGGGGNFMYRYCMNPSGCAGTSLVQWARVRTLVGEVSLPNQQQAFY